MARLQLIGGGKMGEALLVGLVSRGWAGADALHVVEPDPNRQRVIAAAAPGVSVADRPVDGADAVIAVKPDMVATVLPSLAAAGVRRVLSIAAGVRTGAIEAGMPEGAAVVRAMPNTPALVGQGAAAIAPGSAASAADLDWAAGILRAVGTVAIVERGRPRRGDGPVGQRPRLSVPAGRGDARRRHRSRDSTATPRTPSPVKPCSEPRRCCQSSGEDPGRLRENVTSPGGTTAAGLAVMDEADFMGLIDRVVEAAAQRSRELGG